MLENVNSLVHKPTRMKITCNHRNKKFSKVIHLPACSRIKIEYEEKLDTTSIIELISSLSTEQQKEILKHYDK